MAIKNLGMVTSIRQKRNYKKIEKTIFIRLDLNVKEDENKEYNIYINNTKNAVLFPMDREIKVDTHFELSLNKKYNFDLADIDDEKNTQVIGLTESLEK